MLLLLTTIIDKLNNNCKNFIEYQTLINKNLVNINSDNRETLNVLIKLSENILLDIYSVTNMLFRQPSNINNKQSIKSINEYLPENKEKFNNVNSTNNNYSCNTKQICSNNIEDNQLDNNTQRPKQRDIQLKNEEYDFDENLEEESSSDTNAKSIPNIFKYLEVFDKLKDCLVTLINYFNIKDFSIYEIFGYDNLNVIKIIGIIIEIFTNVNYIHNRKVKLTEYMFLSSNQLYTPGQKDIFEEPIHSINTHNSNNNINIEINNNENLLSFINKLTFCFIKYELNSMLHYEYDLIIYTISNKYCPNQIIKSFCKSNILDLLVDSVIINLSNKIILKNKLNMCNICQIATNIFISQSKFIQNFIETSKIKI